MLKFFVITHALFLFFGLLLLLYYAKTGYRLNQEVLKGKKSRIPKPVKWYSYLLLAWIAGSSLYFFSDLLITG